MWLVRIPQVGNLNETGFTPGRYLNSTRRTRVIPAASLGALFPNAHFRYINRIFLLVAVFADDGSIHPAALIKRSWNPLLSVGSIIEKVSRVVSSSLRAFCRKLFHLLIQIWLLNYFTTLFQKHTLRLMKKSRFFYSLTAVELIWHFWQYEFCKAKKNAVVTLPAHISDRLHSLFISVLDRWNRTRKMPYEMLRHAKYGNTQINFTWDLWTFGNRYERLTRQVSRHRMLFPVLKVVDCGHLTLELHAKPDSEQVAVMKL